MVRLINILAQSMKKAAQLSDLPAAPVPVPAEIPLVAQENPYRKKAEAAPTDPLPLLDENARIIYRDLHAAVLFAITQSLQRDQVEAIITRVAESFAASAYSELLQVAYSFSRKNYLPAHIANDVVLTVGFAAYLGFDQRDVLDLGVCAFCHDLGMAGFEPISRKGQPLSAQEIEDIKQHPLRSAEMARPVFSEKIAAVVKDVHERENGQGYPRGIPGVEVPLWSKIIAVCDTFEALTHPRVFRPAYSPYEAIKMIIKKKDILFEDTVVKRFIEFMSIYPVGSLVSLNSGETALVVGANPGSPTRPLVRIIITEKKEIEDDRTPIDLSAKEFIYITGVLAPEKERELLYFLKPRGQVDLDEE